MSEIERVTKNFDIVIESMSREGAQDESVSLALICQGTIEITKELAILNDYLKGKTENEQCESGASASD
jgi:hypothetical protein